MLAEKRKNRQKRIRAKIAGSKEKPRLNVFRSNIHIYGNLVDDVSQHTLASAKDSEVKLKGTKTEKAFAVGKLLAEKAIKKNIKKIVFDRGGYIYHGRVRALAEGAREGGLEF